MKQAVITGATGGIGKCYAEQLAAQGNHLILIANDTPGLQEMQAKIQSAYKGIQVGIITADLCSAEGIRILAQHLGGIQVDLLVNSAGYRERSPFLSENADTIERLMHIHIHAPVQLIHAVLPGMMQRRNGAIITVSSLAAFVPAPGSSIYNASKAFLNAFTESIHMEAAPYNVYVQTLCPGFTNTTFHRGAAHKRHGFHNLLWMQPEEVVRNSLRNLHRKVVCVPGLLNRMIRTGIALSPRKAYYRIAGRLAGRIRPHD